MTVTNQDKVRSRDEGGADKNFGHKSGHYVSHRMHTGGRYYKAPCRETSNESGLY
jgi:hypothetical protein